MACSVLQILRSVESAHFDSWRTLHSMRFWRTEEGLLWYAVGNSAVIFRAWLDGECYSVKCYTSRSPYRKTIYGERLYPCEFYIFLTSERGEWIDVVLERWIDGEPLSDYLRAKVDAGEEQALTRLSHDFDKLAVMMLEADWAHGDVTCDNIIVDEHGDLHLVDFDASFIPEFRGYRSVEVGTRCFQHPLRQDGYFNRDIDDYPLALISTALSAVALDVSLYHKFYDEDGLMIVPSEAVEGRSTSLDYMLDLFARSGDFVAYRVAKMLSNPLYSLPHLCELLSWRCSSERSGGALTLFARGAVWGFVDADGAEAIPPLFDTGYDFVQGYAAIKVGAYWHYITPSGYLAMNGSGYQELSSLRNGVGQAMIDGRWCAIDFPPSQ